MILTALYIIFVIAAFSLIYWGVTQFALPQPVRVILIVVAGLIGLILLWHLVVPLIGDLGPPPSYRHP